MSDTDDRDRDPSGKLRTISANTGVPAIDLSSLTLPLAVLDTVREEMARRLQVLPLRADHGGRAGQLFIACADPNDAAAIDEVAFASGRKVTAYAAAHAALAEAIDEAYAARRRGEAEWRGPRARRGQVTAELQRANVPRSDLAEPARALAPIEPVFLDQRVDSHLRQPAALGPLLPDVREPFDDGASYGGAPMLTDAAARRRPRILVVDDEPIIRRIVHQALTQRNYEVIEAQNGTEALRAIKEKEPDVVLLDAMLPDVHGFDICKRIKASQRYGHIPVIMMTAVYKGWRMEADLKESYGISAYIEKPFDLHVVVKNIENALAGKIGTVPPNTDALSAEAQRLFVEGLSAYKRGELDVALTALSGAVAIDPLSATLRHNLGLLHAQRQNDFAAIQELEMAVDLEPNRYQSLRNLAVCYQRRGFRRKACEMWERALSHAPDEATRVEIKGLLVQLL